MFHAGRWAAAFLAVSGKDANEAYLCLGALAARVKTVRGVLAGHAASAVLEKILREGAVKNGEPGTTFATEYAIRFLCLLVEKKCLKYIDRLLPEIGRHLDEQNGILRVTVESAVPVESGLEKELAAAIKEKTGASGVKISATVRPELLGGFLLRIGGFYIDASLKGQLENMAVYLGEKTGGRNG